MFGAVANTQTHVDLLVAQTEVQKEFLSLVYRRLRLGAAADADTVEQAFQVIAAGHMDQVLEQFAPNEVAPTPPERFDAVKPFDLDAWKKRHNVDD